MFLSQSVQTATSRPVPGDSQLLRPRLSLLSEQSDFSIRKFVDSCPALAARERGEMRWQAFHVQAGSRTSHFKLSTPPLA